MAKLVVNHSTAQWHDLVREAEELNGVFLDEDLESYLVFLLMRYTECTELAARVMALEYLKSANTSGNERKERMRDVGDQCLLFSGLFPARAEKRRVRISYYVNLGRAAYQNVADVAQNTLATMFANLSESFVNMMDTLQAIRRLDQNSEMLAPIEAYELWNDTNSLQARNILSQSSQGFPVKSKSHMKH